MAICGIVFGRAAMGMARDMAMAATMVVALEEEGDGKGRKSDGDDKKEGNGK